MALAYNNTVSEFVSIMDPIDFTLVADPHSILCHFRSKKIEFEVKEIGIEWPFLELVDFHFILFYLFYFILFYNVFFCLVIKQYFFLSWKIHNCVCLVGTTRNQTT